MDWTYTSPTSFRLQNKGVEYQPSVPMLDVFKKKPHDSHPSFDHLIMLVFEAVMEVVCVSLPGYIIARMGHFDADKQKFLANLNVMLFTPCLIFIKLASQLTLDKLSDLVIIPIIFCVQTFVSYIVSIAVAKAFRLGKRPANFVTAMGVFGNSNSLPISLVISLSQTLKGLHWDRIPGDNDNDVAARGILYLLIFQQLGQLVRWSWGYHVLLAPKDKYEEFREEVLEEARPLMDDDPQRVESVYIPGLDGQREEGRERESESSDESEVYEPAGRTPVVGTSTASPVDSEDDETVQPRKRSQSKSYAYSSVQNPRHFRVPSNVSGDEIMSFPPMRDLDEPDIPDGIRGYFVRSKLGIRRSLVSFKNKIAHASRRVFRGLPRPFQTFLSGSWWMFGRVSNFLWDFMNPPLWAMLLAIIVASVPELQRTFFHGDTFIRNSVTSAVKSSAGVAVPLILVVLGANLARNTQNNDSHDPEEEQIGTRLLVASLISRMFLPTLIMAPFLALVAKFVNVSILDDPIFVIVCFLLTGAPSALQLAQICQLNSVYEKTMGKILFQSYVIWILPSTLILVMLALETVEWATAPP